MDLMPDAEEEQIVEAARTLLTTELPVNFSRWQEGASAAKDRSILKQFADLGWIALGLSEQRGGFGFGAAEEALLFREVGRALVSPRLLAAVVAARIAADDDPDRAAELIAGERQAAFAIARPGGLYLIDADDAADIVLVSEDRIDLLSAGDIRNRGTARSTDETVVLETGEVTTDAVPLEAAPDAGAHLSLLIAAMLTGSSEAVRDLTVVHASERTQFGQKIGTFQAVSHPIADMAVRCEAALSQVKVAAIALRDGRADAASQVTAARIVALDAALTNAQSAVQLHGGMGFTAEYPVHYHLKRAHLLDQIGGAMAVHLDRCFAAA